MAGNSAIWRAVTTGAEGSAGTDELIEFNEGVVPDTTSHITTTEIEYDAEPSENEKPTGKVNELQDVGISTITVTVTGSIQAPNVSLAQTTFKKWMIEDKTNSTFVKGQFGLRLNDNPINNLTPVALRGYLLANVKLIRPQEFTGKLDFIARLRFNGDPEPLVW